MQEKEKDNRGGSRPGAGRKSGTVVVPDNLKRKSRTLTMDDARWIKFKALGGTKWLNRMIDAAEVKD